MPASSLRDIVVTAKNRPFSGGFFTRLSDGPQNPWRRSNPHEPEFQVGVGNKQTTVCTEPTPYGVFKVPRISANHEARSTVATYLRSAR
jgi:hypothetical protein